MGAQIGLIGLAVMGENLALNIERNGFPVAVFNRTTEKVDTFMAGRARGKRFTGCQSLEELVTALDRPRRIIVMVKAGAAVDDTIARLVPLLERDDLIIDCGNSHFRDTERRARELAAKGLRFLGTGVSGGEEGALNGPAIMPGGSRDAYRDVEPVFSRIAAKVAGHPCCAYIGDGGAGHFVKMVHNGIEYGDMQLIAEAYWLLKNVAGMSGPEMAETFAEWNRGVLSSYLIEITASILRETDPETGRPMVDVILDAAGQKGTGAWTSQSALELGVGAPTIAEAVFARSLSAEPAARAHAAALLAGPDGTVTSPERQAFVRDVRDALYASKIASYAQGFALMDAASAEYSYNLNLKEIPLVFRGGCIIRAAFLDRIREAYEAPDLSNLLLAPHFRAEVAQAQAGWRRVVAAAVMRGIPVPAFASALSYYDSIRSARLPANLIQAQRDFFGAHTFKRTDRDGTFHHQWSGA